MTIDPELARVGHELFEYLKENPQKSHEATLRLRQELRQMQGKSRHKSIEGPTSKLYPPIKKDKTMHTQTVTFKDMHGKDAVMTAEQFKEQFGVEIGGQVDSETDLTQAEEKTISREVAVRDRHQYNLGSNAKRIGYKLVENMLFVAVIVLAVVAGVVLLKGILWENHGPMPVTP